MFSAVQYPVQNDVGAGCLILITTMTPRFFYHVQGPKRNLKREQTHSTGRCYWSHLSEELGLCPASSVSHPRKTTITLKSNVLECVGWSLEQPYQKVHL
ncbi:hypothetical protein WG66_002387 [Moniliophthora roreri]|nr:hypothetical protein WG66_002387 [Moniliophthora roreri]